MSKSKKHKIAKLTDEQYYQYITSLKNDPAAYNADGTTNFADSNLSKDGE